MVDKKPVVKPGPAVKPVSKPVVQEEVSKKPKTVSEPSLIDQLNMQKKIANNL